ncbi:MAG: DMT family transporter [Chlamydiales bacterium]|nr:DMT family transporter [Chlamydiales bacterium]
MDVCKEENILSGGGLILLAAASYACMGALVKFGEAIPDQQLVFIRNFVCLLVVLPWILLPKPKSLRTPLLGTHLIRATAGLLNMYCFFFSIRYILLADAMLLNNTMPLFIPFVLLAWKGIKIPLKLIPGLITGFIGVIFILHPTLSLFRPAALVALASGFFMSISMVGIRELGKFEPLYRILFYYFLITSIISAIPLFWAWKTATLLSWLILIGVGIFAAVYQFFLTKGYQYAPAQKISPLIYFSVILSGVFDWIFWGDKPPIISYIGVVLVILGAIYCMRTVIQ